MYVTVPEIILAANAFFHSGADGVLIIHVYVCIHAE